MSLMTAEIMYKILSEITGCSLDLYFREISGLTPKSPRNRLVGEKRAGAEENDDIQDDSCCKRPCHHKFQGKT